MKILLLLLWFVLTLTDRNAQNVDVTTFDRRRRRHAVHQLNNQSTNCQYYCTVYSVAQKWFSIAHIVKTPKFSCTLSAYLLTHWFIFWSAQKKPDRWNKN